MKDGLLPDQKKRKENLNPHQYRIPLLLNRFVTPVEKIPNTTVTECKPINTRRAGKVKSTRNRVLLLGDSQARGCADLLKQNLNSDIGVGGFIKPGAMLSDILGTNLEEGMSKNDVVVVCAGSNDISKNNAKEGLRKSTNFVRRSSHTNIIVTEALQRYDLPDWSCVNNEVRLFNRQLAKRLKSLKHVSIGSVTLEKQHFTRHSQHLNSREKETICHQIGEMVQWKLRAVDHATPDNVSPLDYKEDSAYETVKNQGNEKEKIVCDSSINHLEQIASDQHQVVCTSNRVGRPPAKLGKDFL
jgi:hypothetical protein